MTARSTDIGEAITALPDRVAFTTTAREAAATIGGESVAPAGARDHDGARTMVLLDALDRLDDAAVMRIAAIVMASSLDVTSPVVDTVGARLAVRPEWSGEGNATFFDLVRDREVARAMLEEVAGERTARAHTTATGKLMKEIIGNALTGHGRTKVDGWLPRWLKFPRRQYTKRPLQA